jgi:hypothetical protein
VRQLRGEIFIQQREYYPTNQAVCWGSLLGSVVILASALWICKACNDSLRDIIERENCLKLNDCSDIQLFPSGGEPVLSSVKLKKNSDVTTIIGGRHRFVAWAYTCNLGASFIVAAGIPGIVVSIIEPHNKSAMFRFERPEITLLSIIFCLVIGICFWKIECRAINSLIRGHESEMKGVSPRNETF